ncbi:MAG: hypothetical protein ALECFALPRED_002886 [Alectoria fallacina]|uniref:Uncharacterized protein n=1 Tax=Alectoria fallacina TaxID=1903189 RepID=A0A8H3FNH6_9LECA|nr:MAG: hypothetical protein ALECFALPRED_002886 [Alectoria fallacina]
MSKFGFPAMFQLRPMRMSAITPVHTASSLRPDNTTSFGSNRITVGHSTRPLAAPTRYISTPNPIVMAAPDPIITAPPILPFPNTPTPFLVGGQTIATPSNGAVVIGSSTYSPGIRADVFGTAFLGADSIFVDEFIYVLPTYPTEKPILIDGQSIIKAFNDGFVIGDSTVAPDSQTLISGHRTSAEFSSVVVDGST